MCKAQDLSHSTAKGKDWMARREERNGALSTVSLRPAWAKSYLKTNKNRQTDNCMNQDLANSSGLEAKCSNLPSGLRTAQLLALCGMGLVQAPAWPKAQSTQPQT